MLEAPDCESESVCVCVFVFAFVLAFVFAFVCLCLCAFGLVGDLVAVLVGWGVSEGGYVGAVGRGGVV